MLIISGNQQLAMATEHVQDPPRSPPRRTPDHPPYALMISAAIQWLAEEGGSTEPAISSYINSNFDGLPWGHDRLLPYYLHKLTKDGEFVEASPGRFMVAEEEEEPSGLPKSNEGNAAVMQPLQFLPPLPQLLAAEQACCSEYGPLLVSWPERAEPPKTKPNPMKASYKEGMSLVLSPTGYSRGSKMVPKRRGRPPKNKPTPAERTGSVGFKRRGRPPKNRPTLIEGTGGGSYKRKPEGGS